MKIKGNAQIDRERSHDGKVRYGSPVAATAAAYNLEQIRPGGYEIYRCRYCPFYHIGREKDRSMFDYNYKGAVLMKHPSRVWRGK